MTSRLTFARWSKTGRDLFFLIGFVILIGAFTLQIAGVDPRVTRQFSEGSLMSQMIMGFIYLGSVLFFAQTSQSLATIVRSWPIFLFPILALVSALWAPEPELTVRRSIALFGTSLFGLALGSTYTFGDSLSVAIRALVLALILSMLWVVVFPQTGIHQPTDAVEPIHAGKWRGVFAHKNALGAVAGFTFGVVLLYGGSVFSSTLHRLAAIAVTAACLIFAGSGTGFATALDVALIGWLMRLVAAAPFNLRLSLLLVFASTVALLGFFANSLEAIALEALGKDPDLTGRTLYWSYVLPFMSDHWLLGYGYFSGFLSIGATIAAITGLDFGSTHNGYLDILVSFGLVGLIACTLYLGWLLLRSTELILSSRGGAEKTFPICVVFHTVQFNVVESGFLAGNSLWPLLMALAATMLVRSDGLGQRRPRFLG